MFVPKVKNIHFVGIGGIGMSGIAEVLLNLGYHVSGSDIAETPVTKRLAVLGGRIAIGHAARQVHGAQVVVISSAVRPDNPEVEEAIRRRIPVIPRAAMLAELMRLKRGIAIAGAHGKTTTTSMLATILAAADFDPTAVIGGRLDTFGSNARLGQGEFLIAEADESDGSFIHLAPIWAVITNIDREHLDYYQTLESLREAFVNFARRVPFYGAVIAGVDDDNVREILPRIERRIITFGFGSAADVGASEPEYAGDRSSFTVRAFGRELGRLTMSVPGAHNVANALAAVATGLEMDVPAPKILAALEGFRNAHRRFEVLGEVGGIKVVDDYGHHPTEIRATLAATARGWPGRRLVVAFQPHRYTRTRDLFQEFTEAFDDAAELVLTEIYPAGEAPLPGVNAENLARRIAQRGKTRTRHVADKKEIPGILRDLARPGDLVLTLGAGDIWKAGEEFLKMLEAADARG